MTRARTTASVLLLTLAGTVAAAQDAPPPADPANPGYQVEVVVFRPVPASGPGAAGTGSAGRVLPTSPLALGAADLRLGGTVRRLAATGYTPLLYTGWREVPGGTRQWRDLVAADPAAGADGLAARATLYQQGGLFLTVEVALPATTPDSPAPRLRETRRIRGPGLHYLDHPDLGVLATVRSLAPPANAPGSPSD